MRNTICRKGAKRLISLLLALLGLGAYDTERDLFSPIAQVDLGRYPAPYSAALLDTGDAVYIAAGDRVWQIADDGTQQPCAMPKGCPSTTSPACCACRAARYPPG